MKNAQVNWVLKTIAFLYFNLLFPKNQNKLLYFKITYSGI